MDILRGTPKDHGGSFGFHCIVANICGGDVTWVECDKRKKSRGTPTIPCMERVLSTKAGDPGMTVGSDMNGVVVEEGTKLIIE